MLSTDRTRGGEPENLELRSRAWTADQGVNDPVRSGPTPPSRRSTTTATPSSSLLAVTSSAVTSSPPQRCPSPRPAPPTPGAVVVEAVAEGDDISLLDAQPLTQVRHRAPLCTPGAVSSTLLAGPMRSRARPAGGRARPSPTGSPRRGRGRTAPRRGPCRRDRAGVLDDYGVGLGERATTSKPGSTRKSSDVVIASRRPSTAARRGDGGQHDPAGQARLVQDRPDSRPHRRSHHSRRRRTRRSRAHVPAARRTGSAALSPARRANRSVCGMERVGTRR